MIAEKDSVLAERDSALAEKDRILATKDKILKKALSENAKIKAKLAELERRYRLN
jgi:hypothetical protein